MSARPLHGKRNDVGDRLRVLTGFALRPVIYEIPNDAPLCQSDSPVYTSTARPSLEDTYRDAWLRRWARRSQVSMIHQAAANASSIVDAQRLTRPVGGWLSWRLAQLERETWIHLVRHFSMQLPACSCRAVAAALARGDEVGEHLSIPLIHV